MRAFYKTNLKYKSYTITEKTNGVSRITRDQ